MAYMLGSIGCIALAIVCVELFGLAGGAIAFVLTAAVVSVLHRQFNKFIS